MADSKLSALPTGAAIADADLFYSDQSATSVKQPATAIATYLISKTGIGSVVTSGTAGSVLFIDSGGNLAQDNANFFWDDTADILSLAGTAPGAVRVYKTNDHVGNYERAVLDWNTTSNVFTVGTQAGGTGTVREVRYYSAGIPALYRVPNGSGDNWFEGGAGNFTVTGSSNFATGSQSLQSLTTGFNNTAIGDGILAFLTTGNSNFAFGTNALRNTVTGSGNVVIGPNAMQSSISVNNNIAIGSSSVMSSLGGTSSCSDNIAIGAAAFNSLTGGASGTSGNIAIGSRAGSNWTNASNLGNILIGSLCASGVFGDFNSNVVIGTGNIFSITGLSNSTILGCWKGPGSGTLSDIIVLTDGLSGLFGTVNAPALDWNYLTSNVWSFKRTTNAQGLHVYNTFDDAVPTTNYERACLDWSLTSNTFRLASQAGGTGTIRIIAIDGFSKAGAPAASDLPSGTFALINDTSGNQTWLAYNNAGTIRKVQLT